MFISFEGGEGAGKTTLIDRLQKELMKEGYQFVRTREPGGSRLSEHIRSCLLNQELNIKVGNVAELLLFLASRAQHLEELIIPAMRQGKIILCDRFNDSTIVYQGLARGFGVQKTEELCQLVCNGALPDLTLFLDVDPEVGLSRTRRAKKEDAKEDELDRIESEGLDFHRLVREGFQRLARENRERIHTIDANRSEDEVFLEALAIIKSKIKSLKSVCS